MSPEVKTSGCREDKSTEVDSEDNPAFEESTLGKSGLITCFGITDSSIFADR
jgi:hypothetical protein